MAGVYSVKKGKKKREKKKTFRDELYSIVKSPRRFNSIYRKFKSNWGVYTFWSNHNSVIHCSLVIEIFQRLTDLFKSSLTVAILSLTQVGHFNSFVHCRCLEFVSLKLPFLISVSFQQSRLLNRDCTVHFTERCLNSSRLCLDLFLSNNCSGYSWINIRTRTDRGKISAPFVLLTVGSPYKWTPSSSNHAMTMHGHVRK